MRVRSKKSRRALRTTSKKSKSHRRRLRGGAPTTDDEAVLDRSSKRRKISTEEEVAQGERAAEDKAAQFKVLVLQAKRAAMLTGFASVRDARIYPLDATELRSCASSTAPGSFAISLDAIKLYEFVNNDKRLCRAIVKSCHYKLAQWQFLHFYNLLMVLCSRWYAPAEEMSPEKNVQILRRYFDKGVSRSESVFQFYAALQDLPGVSAEVRKRITEIIRYVQSGTRYVSSTTSTQTDFAVHRGDLPFFHAATEILWTLLDQNTNVMTCLKKVPAINELFARDALRLAEKRAEQERRHAQNPSLFPDTHFILNAMHGVIPLTDQRVNTFQIPEDMVVWVVMAATPGNVNTVAVQYISRLLSFFKQGIRPWQLVDALKEALIQDRQSIQLPDLPVVGEKEWVGPFEPDLPVVASTGNKAWVGPLTTHERFKRRMRFMNLAMEPRVMCLSSGDRYINKNLSISKSQSEVLSAQHQRWNCADELESTIISPPLCQNMSRVQCTMSDLVQNAKMRGARQLVICDLSCAWFFRGDSSPSLAVTIQAGLDLLGLPADWARTSSCLSLVQAELAGGARTTS
jgi:hypothetical protein